MNGEREPGVRRSSAPDPLAPYIKARFSDDPHLWASALFDEVVPLGYGGSYPSDSTVPGTWYGATPPPSR